MPVRAYGVLGLGLGILCIQQSLNLVYSSKRNRIRDVIMMEDYSLLPIGHESESICKSYD